MVVSPPQVVAGVDDVEGAAVELDCTLVVGGGPQVDTGVEDVMGVVEVVG